MSREQNNRREQSYKTEQALSGGEVQAANEHQSFVVNTISNQQGGTANACESEVKTSLDFIQPPWTAEKSPVKARRATPRNVSIPPKRRYMRRHSCFAGVQLLGAAPFSTPFTVEYGKTPLTLALVSGVCFVVRRQSRRERRYLSLQRLSCVYGSTCGGTSSAFI